MKLTFIDFFAGIGGFRLGLEQAGYKCIGFCENDKYAVKSYKAMFDTQGEWYNYDVRKLTANELSKANIWTFGFPCQDISIAGGRRGITGKRSSLYFTLIKLLKSKQEEDKPEWIIAENVKNLLSINNGWDFTTVLSEMDEAGYNIEWQVLNSKNFGVPQNRERVYIIGHLRTRSRREILPIGRENKLITKQVIGGSQGCRVYNSSGSSVCLASSGGGLGARTGLYFTYPILTPNRINKRQNGRRIKNENEPMFTITSQDKHGVIIENKDNIRIRRLTPKECFRLQGFPDELYEKAKQVNSDNQLYKQAGNAVTVTVAYAIAKALKESQAEQKNVL